MGMLNFDICALIILAILAASIVTRKLYVGRSNRLYAILLVCIIVSTVTDLISGLYGTVIRINSDNTARRAFFDYIYYISRNITPLVYLLYIISYIGVWHIYVRNMRKLIFMLIPCGISLLLILSNPVTGLIFYFDENLVYCRGSAGFILYIIAIAYISASCIIMLRFRRLLTGDKLFALMSQLPISLMTAFIQYFIPTLLVEMFGSALVVLIISTNLQRGEEIIDPLSGVQSYNASLEDLRKSFETGRTLRLIYISIVNSGTLRTYLGMDRFNAMLRDVGSRITRSCNNYKLRADVYYLQNGVFAVATGETDMEVLSTAASSIAGGLSRSYEIQHFKAELDLRSCVVRCPEDIDGYEGVINFESTLKQVFDQDKRSVLLSEVINSEDFKLKNELDDVIADAIEHRKFRMYYQPIYSARKMKFVSAEALIRLIDDKYGFVSPGLFIPAAEASGAIHQIGDYVLDEVCAFMARSDLKKMGLECIEINLSVAQCVESDLVYKILNVLDKYNLDVSRINLEITETAADFDPTMVDRNVHRLSEKGIRFSLDDYGTGYSNIKRVTALPIDIVKLDKSFVDEMDDPQMWIVIRNTVNMLHEMKKDILVEGVEEEKTLNRFLNLGCEYIQGYYFSRPLPEQEFVKFMMEHNK
ncbi:MAG: EAL domain-containing protein [Lachnospiraceae bacterium]|nr:EAL domain-containing protein [Lachnospiraceae bacterium]